MNEPGAKWRAVVWWLELPWRARLLLLVGVAGLWVRVWLALNSSGSNDVAIWTYFSEHIRLFGLGATYERLDGSPGQPVPTFNHPPPAALWVYACSVFARWSGIRFPVLLKVAGLVGEAGTAVLLWRRWREHGGEKKAAAAVAAFGFALCSILVSGYHGNTDCFLAFLLLLGVYQLEKGKPFTAGAVLAAALNVKLISLFAIPALLAASADRRARLRLLGGMALAVFPFIPWAVTIPGAVFHNVVAYTPIRDFWGINGLFLGAEEVPRLARWAASSVDQYTSNYRYFLLAALVLSAVWARRTGMSAAASALVAMCLFLILTPGFGVQYTAILCPLMFAVNYRWGLAWATVSGACILVLYVAYYDGTTPWHSTFTGPFPTLARMTGLVAWGLLIQLVGFLLLASRRSSQRSPVSN